MFFLFIVDFYPESPLVLCLCVYLFNISIQSVPMLCFACLLWVSIKTVPLLCFACLLWVSIKTVPLICFACVFIFFLIFTQSVLLCFIYLLLVSIKTLPLLCCTCVFIVCFCPDRPLSFVLPLCIVLFLSRTSPLFFLTLLLLIANK